MRYKKLLLILFIVTLSLTACKKEQNPAPAETTAIEETAVEKETTEIEDAETKEAENIDTTEIEAETTPENISVETADTTENALDPSNITVNPDGTYSFTDNFLVAVQTINGAAGLTDDRLDIALQNAADAIINMGLDNEQDIISTIETEIAIQEYNQFKEEANQGGGNSSNNSGSQQTQQNQNQSQGGNTSSENGEDQVAPGPVEEQVIGGPGFSDGNSGGQIAHDTVDDWR